MKQTPSHPETAPQIPTDEPAPFDWDVFWFRNKSRILFSSIAVIAAVVVAACWYTWSAVANESAQSLFAQASDATALEAVVKSYPGTRAGASALLALASTQRDAGNMDASTGAFQQFLAKFPDDERAGAALFGIGQNQEAVGKSQEAMETYKQVPVRFPKSYAAPFALYCQSEILLRDFRRDEARAVLDSILIQYNTSLLANLASSQIARMGQAPAAPAPTVQP